jgi:lipopolysaccharide/colanic/teichoic acid biosynthesis glycosyltransferase
MSVKRLLDVVVAATALVALMPLLLLLALLVRLDSKGPPIFRQRRVGLGGKEFLLLKLRTMYSRPDDGAGAFEPGNISRVTPLGRHLRRLKLDELPQLWNVLVGEMSLVGPRPEVRQWVEVYPERWTLVHTVRPGLTDPASLVYRNEEALLAQATDPEKMYREVLLPHKLELYAEYVRNRSLGRDLAILAQTVRCLLHMGG